VQLEEERERERVEREEAASKEEDEGKRKVCVPCSSAGFAPTEASKTRRARCLIQKV
jgi:hypothetical protein